MILSSILLQAASGANAGASGYSSLLVLILIFVVFYFFMIRPQNKKQKEIQKARAALKQGDRIVTSGGIYGKIREVKDDSFIIEISDNVRVRVEKTAVFAAHTPEATEEKK
ncbi:MAG: preprotein translocase subunit YajC [Bacteroidota bacterium]|nr:preprotein translocase subunit YajC [Bacteroidota bacterium]